MKVHFPNSAFLGNIDKFLELLDTSDSGVLSITFNKKWISVHPVILALTVALGQELKTRGGKIEIEAPEAKSKHYLERMGMFKQMGVESKIRLTDHEPAGRFIPVTCIANSEELNHFIENF